MENTNEKRVEIPKETKTTTAHAKQYIVNVKQDTLLNVRSTPKYGNNKIGTLKRNEIVTVLKLPKNKHTGDFVKISCNGITGFVASKFLSEM